MSNRMSNIQVEILVSYMETHGDLSKPGDGPLARKTNLQHWGFLFSALNSDLSGCKKTEDKWRKTWSDLKNNLKKKVAKINRTSCDTGHGHGTNLKLTPLEERILAITKRQDAMVMTSIVEIGSLQGEASTDENTAPFATQTPKKRSFFQKVRSRCVALVVKHGRPAELLDDTAFKDILNLIPMTKVERSKLTSEAIKEYIESTEGAEEKSNDESFLDADDDDEFKDDDDEMELETELRKRKVKNEKPECSCPSRDAGTHETGCPGIGHDPYWQYFEVSIDEATCKLCSNVIKWSSMTDLKVHLAGKHPSVQFKDDDDEFTADRGRQDSEGGGSIPDQTVEEIYLEEDIFQQPTRPPITPQIPPSTAKKRRYPPETMVTLKDSETISLERFKSLDRFGLYVASLMKLLPVEKSLKYQEQIVQRLIREQAAAG